MYIRCSTARKFSSGKLFFVVVVAKHPCAAILCVGLCPNICSVPEFSFKFVQAILCAGLCPNIAEGLVNRLTKPAKETQRYAIWHDGKREVHIHPSSINKNCKAFQYPFIVFLEKVCESFGFTFVLYFWSMCLRISDLASY